MFDDSQHLAYIGREIRAVLGSHVLMSVGGTTVYSHYATEEPQELSAEESQEEIEGLGGLLNE